MNESEQRANNLLSEIAKELERQYKAGWNDGWGDGYKTGWNDKKQKLAGKTLNKNESPYLEEQ